MSLLPFFYDFEEPYRMTSMAMMGRDFSRPDVLMPFNGIRRNGVRPRDHIRPLEQLSRQMQQLNVGDFGIVDDKDKFQVSVDVQHFSPGEISVKVIEGHVIVEGRHEEKQDGHGFVSRHFKTRYALPRGCLADTVESQLSSDGVLTVSAPKILALPSIGERIIPITQTGPIRQEPSSSEP